MGQMKWQISKIHSTEEVGNALGIVNRPLIILVMLLFVREEVVIERIAFIVGPESLFQYIS
jgi:hypothetical protein